MYLCEKRMLPMPLWQFIYSTTLLWREVWTIIYLHVTIVRSYMILLWVLGLKPSPARKASWNKLWELIQTHDGLTTDAWPYRRMTFCMPWLAQSLSVSSYLICKFCYIVLPAAKTIIQLIYTIVFFCQTGIICKENIAIEFYYLLINIRFFDFYSYIIFFK